MGLKWSALRETLNPSYNWAAAIQAAMGSDEPLEEVWNLLEFTFLACNIKKRRDFRWVAKRACKFPCLYT